MGPSALPPASSAHDLTQQIHIDRIGKDSRGTAVASATAIRALDDIETETVFSSSDESEFSNSNSESCPYVVGLTITAMRHEPPDPFGHDYETCLPATDPVRCSMSQEEICLLYLPQPGRTQPQSVKSLTITSIIRSGSKCGNQLVVVNNSMVAKLYDPMYYDIEDLGSSDVIAAADRAYSREAAAYAKLQHVESVADLIPAFYGSWTTEIKTETVRDGVPIIYHRSVRLILIEHIRGRCMESLNPHDLPQYVRSVLLRSCIDAEIRILHAGVNHGDLCPRNIVVVGGDYETPNLQVKVIDFDMSGVYDHPRYAQKDFAKYKEERERKWFPKRANPLVRYWGKLNSFVGWYPDHDDGDQWLKTQFKNDERYFPVVWDLDKPYSYPKYA